MENIEDDLSRTPPGTPTPGRQHQALQDVSTPYSHRGTRGGRGRARGQTTSSTR